MPVAVGVVALAEQGPVELAEETMQVEQDPELDLVKVGLYQGETWTV